MVNINPMQEHHGGGDNVTQNKYVYYIQEDGSKKAYPRELTLISSSINDIIGREDEIKEIYERLAKDTSLILVNGMGGIGKTTVALEYINRYGGDYDHLAWIEVTDKIATAFATNIMLIDNLQLTFVMGQLPKENYEDLAFEKIINRLNDLNNCLLVIDNANDLDDLQRCRHRLHSLRATTLLTSRAHPEEWQVVTIKELAKKYAANLFQRHFAAGVQPEQMEMLWRLLDCLVYHTLLIELLAKAATKARLSLEELYDKVQANYLQDADLNARKVSTGAHADHTKLPQQELVDNYIKMVFQEISKLDETEQRFLRYMCLLPPNTMYKEKFLLDIFSYHPKNNEPKEQKQNFFQRLFKRKRNASVTIEDKNLTSNVYHLIADGLERLAAKGWLTQKREAEGYTYKLHSVIQDVAIQELGISYERCAPVVDYWNDALDIDQTKDNPVEKFTIVQYGAYIIDKLGAEQHENIVDLLDNVGIIKWHLGKYHEAASLMEKALTMAISIFGDKHATVANLQSNLANVYADLGKYARARELLSAALASDLQNFGEAHPTVAVRQSNLANVYEKLGEYARARELLSAALANAIKNFGETHPNVARCQSNLANVYSNLGDYARARELLELALASDIQNFGEAHPNVARCQSNLADVYRELGDYARARDLLSAALASDIQNFGEAHPTVAVRQSNLALVYRELGDYARARDLLSAALANAIQNFEEAHPNVAVRQSNLANVYNNLGEYARARDLLSAALASDIKNFGEAHPNVAYRLNNLAWVEMGLNNLEAAKSLFERAYQIFYDWLGPDHPNTKTVAKSLANVKAQLDQSDGA